MGDTRDNDCGESNNDNENDVFERIADKLIRSGLYLTALELHAEMIERGKELMRLREFFDNAQNFEKNPEIIPQRQPQHYLQVQSPSEHTFDSCDFSHFSDEQPPLGGIDERVAVLEFELRKAQQTINSLRASLTESTTATSNNIPPVNAHISLTNYTSTDGENAQSTIIPDTGMSYSLNDTNRQQTDIYSEFGRGSADGDSCPGEDNQQPPPIVGLSSSSAINNIIDNTSASMSSLSLTKSSSLPIKPHEKRVLNFLANEFLRLNNYKLTSITFADEIADQDLDRWEDVGLDVERPPDLLKLYRQHWQNSLQRSNS